MSFVSLCPHCAPVGPISIPTSERSNQGSVGRPGAVFCAETAFSKVDIRKRMVGAFIAGHGCAETKRLAVFVVAGHGSAKSLGLGVKT